MTERRAAFLLAALLLLPLLLGSATPAALSIPVQMAPHAPAPFDTGVPPTTAATSPGPTAWRLHPEEVLARHVPPVRPATPAQHHRVSDHPPARAERALPPPTLRPGDPSWVARRLEIPALGVDVAVAMAANASVEDFPPHSGAYILRSSSQPGRGTNAYLFAHAMPNLFKPLWVAQPGQQVIVTMSDGQQLGYRVTAVVRDIPCPDPSVHKPAGLPPALANATECDMSWTLPTPTERLTMQTSQGFNRNYGEMVVIAEPDW